MILLTGGGIPACIAGGIPACLTAGLWGVLLLGGCGPGGCLLLGGSLGGGVCVVPGVSSWGVSPGGVPFCYGLLLWSSVMPFWFGGLLIEGGLLVWSFGGGRRPHQKAITVAWWRPPRKATAAGSTHPTGMHSCLTMYLSI